MSGLDGDPADAMVAVMESMARATSGGWTIQSIIREGSGIPNASGGGKAWRYCEAHTAHYAASMGRCPDCADAAPLTRMIPGPRLSASWEHLPDVTMGARLPARPVDPLVRAIGVQRSSGVGLLTGRA